MPDRMSGRYFAMTLALKNVSRNRSHWVMAGSAALQAAHHDHERTGVARSQRDHDQCRWICPMKARVRSCAGLSKICSRRPLLDDQAVVHEHHAIGGGAGEAHLVADHDHGHAALAQAAHDRQHRTDQLGIERRGRLVEQHDPRLERDRAGDGDPLLLAARQLGRPMVARSARPTRSSAARPSASASARDLPATLRSASVTLPSAVMCG